MTRIRQGMTGKWNMAEYDSHTTGHDGKVEYGGI
jgi:hypothetical protein